MFHTLLCIYNELLPLIQTPHRPILCPHSGLNCNHLAPTVAAATCPPAQCAAQGSLLHSLFSHPPFSPTPPPPFLTTIPPSPPCCILPPCLLLWRIHNRDLQVDDNEGCSRCSTLSVGTLYFRWYTMPKVHSMHYNSAVVSPIPAD
jgi:hypothetical protein